MNLLQPICFRCTGFNRVVAFEICFSKASKASLFSPSPFSRAFVCLFVCCCSTDSYLVFYTREPLLGFSVFALSEFLSLYKQSLVSVPLFCLLFWGFSFPFSLTDFPFSNVPALARFWLTITGFHYQLLLLSQFGLFTLLSCFFFFSSV